MPRDRHFPKRLGLLHDDSDLLVVSKEAGFLSCDIRGGTRPNALDALSDWLKRGVAKSRNRAWLVHRLDRDTSGVMVFAKSEDARNALQASWDTVEKVYLAALAGAPARKSGRLEDWLREDENMFVHCCGRNAPGAKFSALEYGTVSSSPQRSLVRVRLLTGRKNQIRVQFAHAGNPVLGDSKYGRTAGIRAPRLMLHALSISFTHPRTGGRLAFEVPAPPEFRRMFPDAFHDEGGRPPRA